LADDLATQLRDELARLLAPLAAAATPDGVARLLAALGRPDNNDAVRAEVQRLAALATGIGVLDASVLSSWDGLQGLLSLSRELLAALRGVEGVVSDPVLAGQLEGLGVELTEFVTGQFLRAEHPRIHRAASVLTLVDPAELEPPVPAVVNDSVIVRLPWQRDRLHFDRLPGLISDPFGTLRAAYFPNDLAAAADAHESARRIFPLLRDLARILRLSSSDGPFDPAAPPPTPPASDEVIADDPDLSPPPPPTEDPPPPDPVVLTAFQHTYFPRLLLALPGLLPSEGGSAPLRLSLAILVSSAEHPGGVRGLLVTPTGELSWTEMRGSWQVTMTADGQIPAFVIGPDGLAVAPSDTPVTRATATLTVGLVAAPGAPAFRLGSATGTRLELGTVQVGIGTDMGADHQSVGLSAEATKAVLVLAAGDGDGFLNAVLPAGGIRADLDFGIILSSEDGLRLKGGVGLGTSFPMSVSVGPARLDSISLAITTTNGVALEATAAVSVEIGPVTAVIDGAGLRLAVSFPPGGGNLGPVDLEPGFRAPTGVGLSVNAGVLAGGGYLRRDPGSGRYAGVLDLRALQVDITALGLLDTKLPAGHTGYALLLALRATFPAVQIGLGFALTGVGGLLALNRRVDVDALRDRLAAGTAGRILAPADPVRNAPALLADLETVFPVAPGVTVVGPTVQLLWAGLVHLDVGVFIELPGPARVVLLGSAHAEIERGGRAYLGIRVDIVGVVDLRAATAAFDAVLVDSHLMGTLDVTGGAAFRLSWGDQPYAVLSLGGFNPAYHPEPLSFPATLAPIAMVHGTPGDELYLRFEGYFAITSNTLQFGASVEVRIHSDPFTVHGTVGFDALIQFEPFHFQVDIRASVSLAYHGDTLAGLTLTGSLTGPGPVVLYAKVCIELLFFDICYSGTFRLGPSSPPPVPAAADLLNTLLTELTNPARLRAAGEPDRHVRLRPPDPLLTTPVVSPTGALVWEQQRAPLGLLLTRISGTPLPTPAQVTATSAASPAPVSDWFAPGQFTDLTDDQALTRPAYERLTSGLRLGGTGTADGPGALATLTTRQIRLPRRATTPGRPVIPFPSWIVTPAAAPATPAITVGTENWIVTTPAGDRSNLTGAQARQLATLTASARAIPATDRLAALAF
jgi:hypothetical protein